MNEGSGFDLPEIDAFVAIARCGSFGAAADALGITQSTISQRIAKLERRLERRLLVRTTRHVALTTEGRDLMVYAEAMTAIADTARLHFERPPRDGVLRLGIVEDFVVGDLHRILSIFVRQYPRFAITLRTGLSTRLFEAVDGGELDVAIAKQKPGRGRGRLLFSDRLRWSGSAGAVEGRAAVPLALFPAPSATRTAILDTLRDARRPWSIAAESLGLAGIVAAIESGFAISAFSSRLVPAGLAVLDAGLPALPSLDYVIDQRAEPRDPAIDAFVQILVATIGDATMAADPA